MFSDLSAHEWIKFISVEFYLLVNLFGSNWIYQIREFLDISGMSLRKINDGFRMEREIAYLKLINFIYLFLVELIYFARLELLHSLPI